MTYSRCFALGLAFCALSVPSQAQSPSGVRPEVLSMPDGPGSIEGLGDTFEPNAATGTSSYAVPLEIPPGWPSVVSVDT